MGRSISHLSDVATQDTNTADVLTPILSVTPDDSTFLRLHNRVQQGKAQGLPLIMDLRDGSNNQLPTDTTVILRVEKPEDDEPTAVAGAETNISPWNQMTMSEQRNSDNIDAVKVELKSRRINVRDSDTLTVDVNSSAQIDWTNSELYFVREGVDELPLES